MRFALLKDNHRLERMRFRGLTGTRDEFHLAAIVQNLKTLSNHVWRPPPDKPAATWALAHMQKTSAAPDPPLAKATRWGCFWVSLSWQGASFWQFLGQQA